MSDYLPYEKQLQQQWTDIPLPAEDVAWEDMRKRLEEDDDRGFFFWWRPGCAWWGLFLILIGFAWWIIRSDKQPGGKDNEPGKDSVTIVNKNKSGHTPAGTRGQKHVVERSNDKIPAVGNDEKNRLVKASIPRESIAGRNNKEVVMTTTPPVLHRTVVKTRNNKPGKQGVLISHIDSSSIVIPAITGTDSGTGNPSNSPEPADSTVITSTKTDSTKKTKTAPPEAKKPDPVDSTSKQRLFFSTGLAMQQQLPVAGQKATPYNSAGRKSSLADYIPSVYVRLHKKDKWFLQAEFRYGAPQYSREFVYQQVSISDTGRSPRITTNTAVKLKKTFYHQLPLSFHYYVLPNWSVGAGVIWNKFYAAVSDKETIQHNNVNQLDSVIFKGIVSTKKDTTGTFTSSYFHALIETQYQWKRLSIGARYAFGLQPYIRFTLPGAGTKEEKNMSIQAFLRFELWRSKQEKREQ